MKTTLKTLQMKGLRSFVEPTTIEFPENGLLLFMGPSGSGKSSIFMGVSHALGFAPYSATELQSWLGDEKLEVKLTLGTSDGDSTIVRGPKSFVEGVGAVSGASNITPTIQKLTGLSTELLSALTYRPQRSTGLFLSKTNAEMQEFLSILLGLNKFDGAIEKTTENIKRLSFDAEALPGVVANLKAAMDAQAAKELPSVKDESSFASLVIQAENLYTLHQEAYEAEVAKKASHQKLMDAEALRFKIRKAEATQHIHRPPVLTTTSEVEELQNTVEQAKTRLARLRNDDAARQNQIRDQLTNKNRQLTNLKLALERSFADRRKKEELERQITQLKDAKCPRCKQGWSASESDLLQTEGELADIVASLEKVENVEEAIEALSKEIGETQMMLSENPTVNKMREFLAEAQSDLQKAQHKIDKFNSEEIAKWQAAMASALAAVQEEETQAIKVAAAERDAYSKVVTNLSNQTNQALLAWTDAKHRLEAVKKENEYARKETVRLTADLALAREKHEQGKGKLDLAERSLREEQDLLEMLKAFLTAIFDEVLEEIAYSANQMLGSVPNVSHVTIKFRSETTTQKGTTKRAITPVLNIGGGERPLRSALSGGMMSAVELAVDLAVRKVISARSGAIPGWLILDECFEGLGPTEKEACLELLKQASQDTLILVIDHGSETKELFTQTITVENTDGRSSIV